MRNIDFTTTRMGCIVSFRQVLATSFNFIVFFSLAQEEIGLNPPSLKWDQITTPAGRVIFPRGLDSLAFEMARLMNYQRGNDQTIAGTRITQRIPVILQNQSTLPAGFATPAPWRSEYYLTPPQNMFLGPVYWEVSMPVHEYRHAQQFSVANQGFMWLYKVLMGQTGWLLNTLITQPLWFREGDAVVGETVFTLGGRGRLPSFHMEYRAMRLAGYHYNYEKAHYTSFRDFVPNPYRIGYYMVTKGRKDHGETLWTKVLSDTYKRKGFFYPFSRSLQEHTGMTTKQFYNATVRELDSLWKTTDQSINETNAVVVSSPKSKKYTSYRFPHYLPDGKVLVLKSGLDLINTYYTVSDGEEQKRLSFRRTCCRNHSISVSHYPIRVRELICGFSVWPHEVSTRKCCCDLNACPACRNNVAYGKRLACLSGNSSNDAYQEGSVSPKSATP